MQPDMYGSSVKRVVSLVLRETGSYNQAYRRPWELHMSNKTQQRIMDVVGFGTAVSADSIADTAASALTFSANYEAPAGITNGWDTKRYIFILTLEFVSHLGIRRYERITGHTESIEDVTAGLGFGGSNPTYNLNAVFVINSAETIREVSYNRPSGRYNSLQQGQSVQVLADSNYTGAYGGDSTRLLRPEDIFSGIDEQSIQRVMHQTGRTGMVYYEPSCLTATGALNKRGNSVASTHMATTINSFLNASRVGDTNAMDLAQQYSAAKTTAKSGYPTDLSFVDWLTGVKGGMDISTFTLAQLCQFDQNAVNVIERIELGGFKSTLHTVGQTEYWDRPNAETLFATAVTTGVTAHMISCELVSVHFHATNNVIGCQTVVVVSKAQGIDPNADYSMHVDRFKALVGNALLASISNGMMFTVECKCSAAGDCTVSVSLNGNETVTYNSLTPADATWSPVITKRVENLGVMANGFDTLFTGMADAYASRHGSDLHGHQQKSSSSIFDGDMLV